MFGRLELYGLVYAATFAAAAVLWVAARKRSSGFREIGEWPSLWASISFLLILTAEAIPTFAADFPHGWDPSFHCILARKILQSGALAADWRPFEVIPVNYTQGLHVLIALISRWTGQPVHLTFQLLHLVVQPLAALLVYRLARVIFSEDRVALLAMLVYALLCNYGSFRSYFHWGGLPTQIGSLFFLAIVWIAMTGEGKKHALFSVLLFGSLTMTHHLSALIGTWVMLFYIVVSALTHTGADLRRKLLLLLPLTFLVYAFYILPYATRASGLGATDALHYRYDFMKTGWQVLEDLGYVASLLGVIGLVLASRRLVDARKEFLLCWVTALMLGFCLLGYIYRIVAALIYGEDLTAFTPSRFLTVVSYPLAMCGGYALHTGLERLSRRFSLKPDIFLGVIVAAILLVAVPDVREMANLRTVTQRGYEVGRFIEQTVPEGGFFSWTPEVRKILGPIEWIPYLTWRTTLYTPLPASENRAPLRRKFQILDVSRLSDVVKWLKDSGLEGFVARQKEDSTIVIRRITWEYEK